MININILGAIRQIVLTFHAVGSIIRVHFDEISLRVSPGFQELWEINYPPENFSASRAMLSLDGSTKGS
jgi:hypothetical protein